MEEVFVSRKSVKGILAGLSYAGYKCGVGIDGVSSYPTGFKFLPDGRKKWNVWEIWAYIPDPELEKDIVNF